MHEGSKLKEARHFLERMRAQHASPAEFTHELSAFLGSARSVLQHAVEEAKLKPGGQQWYDHAMADALFIYFKDLRDNSVHKVPVAPLAKMKTETAGVLTIGEGEDEMVIPFPHTTVVFHYEFQNRPGEEVAALSLQYLNALEDFVADGVASGWIAG